MDIKIINCIYKYDIVTFCVNSSGKMPLNFEQKYLFYKEGFATVFNSSFKIAYVYPMCIIHIHPSLPPSNSPSQLPHLLPRLLSSF